MPSVGSYEAKTHLPQLLDRVANGEKFLITKRGKPVAMLVPPDTGRKVDVRQVVQEMLTARDKDGPKLRRGLSIRQLIEEGRRY